MPINLKVQIIISCALATVAHTAITHAEQICVRTSESQVVCGIPESSEDASLSPEQQTVDPNLNQTFDAGGVSIRFQECERNQDGLVVCYFLLQNNRPITTRIFLRSGTGSSDRTVMYGIAGDVYPARQVWVGNDAINIRSTESYISIGSDLPSGIPVKATIGFPTIPPNELRVEALQLGYQTGMASASDTVSGTAFFRDITIR